MLTACLELIPYETKGIRVNLLCTLDRGHQGEHIPHGLSGEMARTPTRWPEHEWEDIWGGGDEG